MAYADVLVTTKVNNFAGCYFRCCIAVSGKLPALVCYFTYCFQLAYVYSIGIISAICYTGNLLVICVQTAAGDVCLVSVAYAFVFIHEEVASFYAVYGQVFLQLNLNIFTSISYCDISTITFESNSIIICAIRANLHSSFVATICSKFPALIHYLLQLSFSSSLAFINSKVCITNFCIIQAGNFSALTVNLYRRLAIACYANYYVVFAKGSIVNLNISTIKTDSACTCAFDRLHAGQIFADRNCIVTINFDASPCGIGGVGICNDSFVAIYSNGGSFLCCILRNFYPRTGFDGIINTINFKSCCSTRSANSLYLRTSSKGLISCTIRNLNESVTAASTATAGNINNTINCLTAISQQADSCRIFIFSQSNFFNIVTIQLFFIFQ